MMSKMRQQWLRECNSAVSAPCRLCQQAQIDLLFRAMTVHGRSSSSTLSQSMRRKWTSSSAPASGPSWLRVQLLKPVQRHDRLLPDLRSERMGRSYESSLTQVQGHQQTAMCSSELESHLASSRTSRDVFTSTCQYAVAVAADAFEHCRGFLHRLQASMSNFTEQVVSALHVDSSTKLRIGSMSRTQYRTRGCSWSSSLTTGASTATSRSGLISLHVAVSAVHTALTTHQGKLAWANGRKRQFSPRAVMRTAHRICAGTRCMT